jgi:electron transfer flavoprotein alpha subunit
VKKAKEIWVLPELDNHTDEIGPLSLGLLSEARYIADEINGTVTALVLSDIKRDYKDLFSRYGVTTAYLFEDPLLEYYSPDTYSAVVLDKVRSGQPWMLLMGNTIIGKELASRLSVLLDTGLISNCVKMDLGDINNARFYRPLLEGQIYQEVIFQTDRTRLVTMNSGVLNIAPASQTTKVKISVIKPKLSPDILRIKHQGFLPVDFRAIDVTDADVVVSAGMGTISSDSLALVEELAGLIGGAIGTTRPVIDEGVLPKERMIGQTGKVVKPGLYLAMGISGSTHHIGGIKDSGTIVAINNDPNAPIFQNSDLGIIDDVRNVLPKLIERIKQEKKNGSIL